MTKSNKKALISSFLIIALIISSVFAMLTARDSKKNTFTVGKVDIRLGEDNWYDEEGNLLYDSDKNGVNDFAENVVPNVKLDKAPYIENIGRNDAYVYMGVSIPVENMIPVDDRGVSLSDDNIVPEELFILLHNEGTDTEPIYEEGPGEGWNLLFKNTNKVDENGNEYNYYIYYYDTLTHPGDKTTPLFDKVKIRNFKSGTEFNIDYDTVLYSSTPNAFGDMPNAPVTAHISPIIKLNAAAGTTKITAGDIEKIINTNGNEFNGQPYETVNYEYPEYPGNALATFVKIHEPVDTRVFNQTKILYTTTTDFDSFLDYTGHTAGVDAKTDIGSFAEVYPGILETALSEVLNNHVSSDTINRLTTILHMGHNTESHNIKDIQDTDIFAKFIHPVGVDSGENVVTGDVIKEVLTSAFGTTNIDILTDSYSAYIPNQQLYDNCIDDIWEEFCGSNPEQTIEIDGKTVKIESADALRKAIESITELFNVNNVSLYNVTDTENAGVYSAFYSNFGDMYASIDWFLMDSQYSFVIKFPERIDEKVDFDYGTQSLTCNGYAVQPGVADDIPSCYYLAAQTDKWENKEFTVTFNDTINNVQSTQNAFIGDKIILPAADECKWCMGTESYEPGSEFTVTEDCVLTLVYKDVAKYLEFEYHYNDNTAVIVGAKPNVVGNLEIPHTITKDGQEFTITEIGVEALAALPKLTSVSIPNTVTEIHAQAFGECKALESVTFESGSQLKAIPQYTFAECTSLESIDIPEGIESLGYNAFLNCTSLKTATLPSTLKSSSGQAFNNCSSLSTINYKCGKVDVQSSYNNPKVIFYNCSDYVPSLTINLGNTAYCDSYISDAYNLSEVHYDGTLTEFMKFGSNGLFSYPENESLFVKNESGDEYKVEQTLTVPQDVKVIPDDCFKGYGQITELDITENVKYVGDSAFAKCKNLNTILFNADNAEIIADWAYGAPAELIIGDSIKTIPTNLLSGITASSVAIPASVEVIKDKAFADSGLSSCEFEDGSHIKEIGSQIFMDSNIRTVNLPDNEITFAKDAFKGVDVLNYSGPSGSPLDTWGALYRNPAVDDSFIYTDEGATIIKCINSTASYIEIPASVNKISANAFAGTNVKEVSVPASISPDNIHSTAFEGLTNVIYPVHSDSDTQTFGAAYRNKYFKENEDGDTDYVFVYSDTGHTKLCGYTGSDTEIVIPLNVIEIENSAFQNNTSITSVAFEKDNEGSTNITTIGNDAFYGCSKLEETNLPDSVESIGAQSFRNCTSLTTVNLPDNEFFTAIPDYAFCNCLLGNTVIPESVTAIGNYAFNLNQFTEITIPASVTSIGNNAFANNYNVTFVEFTDNSNISSIGSNAFSSCGRDTNIESIVVPACVNSIGSSAFNGVPCLWCESTKISATDTFGASVRNGYVKGIFTYKDSAFTELVGCKGDAPADLVIPDGTKSISSSAFANKRTIKNVTIPASVETIGDKAFYSINLDSLTFAKNSNLKTIGASAFYRYSSTYNKSVIVPDTVTSIGSSAFYYWNCLTCESPSLDATSCFGAQYRNVKEIDGFIITLDGTEIKEYVGSDKNIVIPDEIIPGTHVTTIGNKAFYSKGITSVQLPSTLTSIGSQAFYWDDLTEVQLPASLTTIGSNAFYSNEITDVIIPANIKEIGNYAFQANPLETVTFEGAEDGTSKLTSIGSSAFSKKTTSPVAGNVRVPDSVKTIGSYAFDRFYNLICNSSSLSSSNAYGALYRNANIVGDYVLSSDGKTVQGYIGSSTKLTLPSGITTIAASAFSGNTTVTKIVIPDTVTTIGESAFANCTALQKLQLPSSLTLVSNSMCEGCSSLKTIHIPENVTGVNSDAFSGCSSLSYVKFDGNKVKYIGGYAFSSCNLTAFCVPNGVESLGCRILSQNKNLRSLYLPNTIIDGGKSAPYPFDCRYTSDGLLYGVYSGTTDSQKPIIYSNYTSEPSSWNVKNSQYWDVYLIQSGTNYLCKKQWKYAESTFISKFMKEPAEEPEEFEPDFNATSITIPSNSSISANLFKNFTNLETVVIEEGVKEIGENAFEGCSSLKSINIPDSLTDINNSAFRNCTSLETVTFGVNINTGLLSKGKYIGENAFDGCTSLVEFIMPELSDGWYCEIDSKAFANCTSLKTIEFPQDKSANSATSAYIYPNFCYNCPNLENLALSMNAGYHDGSGKRGQSISGYGITSLKTLTIKNDSLHYGTKYYTTSIPVETIILPNATEITSYICVGNQGLKNVIIGDKATAIDDYAFNGCSKLESVQITENGSLQSIGIGAFDGCGNLNEFACPGSPLSSIGNYTFRGCISLESFDISETLLSIGDFAFAESGLTHITIPDTVTSYGIGVFNNCINLSKAVVYTSTLPSFDNCNLKSAGPIGSGADLEYNFVNIPDNAFSGSPITSITFADGITSIGNSAFASSSLSSVQLPDSLLSIGESAFYKSALTEVEIPDSVTEIGDRAFYRCSELESISFPQNTTFTSIPEACCAEDNALSTVEIPSTVTSIEESAFSECYALSSEIPSTVTYIGHQAFENIANIKYNGSASGANWGANSVNGITDAFGFIYRDTEKTVIVGYQGTEKDVVTIPSSATTLSSGAFLNVTLNKLIIPDTITQIETNNMTGYSAFTGSNIKEVEWNSPLTSVPVGCFMYSSVEKVSLPEVTDIGAYAFENCHYLTSVYAPKLQTVGQYAFAIESDDVENVLTEIDLSNVTHIGEEAFYRRTNLENVKFNTQSLENIGNYAFYRCENLSSFGNSDQLVLPETLEYLGNHAFGNSGVSSLQLPDNMKAIQDGVFYGCPLTSLTCGSSLEAIGNDAFRACENLSSVTLNDSLITIGDSAFRGCALTELIIPASVQTINNYAFDSNYLTSFAFAENSELKTLGKSVFVIDIDSLSIPNSVTSIGESCFMGKAKSLSFAEPSSLTELGAYAFPTVDAVVVPTSLTSLNFNFTNAKSITIPDDSALETFGWWGPSDETLAVDSRRNNSSFRLEELIIGKNSKLTNMPNFGLNNDNSYYYQNETLKRVDWPDSISIVPEKEFYCCVNLETVNIPGVTKIEQNAFAYTALTNIVFNSGLSTIGDFAFFGSDLTEVQIPASVITVGNSAFSSNNIRSLSFPKGPLARTHLESIGEQAFFDNKLQNVIVPDNVAFIGANAFGGTSTDNKTINVMYNGSYGLATDSWGALYRNKDVRTDDNSTVDAAGFVISNDGKTLYEYEGDSKSIEIPEGVETIEEKAFYRKDIEYVYIPSSVKYIKDYAFSDTNLHSVTLPDELQYIGNYAFAYCHFFGVSIPGSVVYIGDYAFDGNSLEYLWFKADSEGHYAISTVGNNAFKANAADNVSVLVPDTVTSIGANAFYQFAILECYSNHISSTDTFGATYRNVKLVGDLVMSTDGKTLQTYLGSTYADVVIPDGVETIKEKVFYNKHLSSVQLPESLKVIEANAFYNNNFTSLTIPCNVETIGNYAFQNTKLKQLNFAQNSDGEYSIKTIGSYAFSTNYDDYVNVTVPDTVESIGSYAFNNFYNLTCHSASINETSTFGASYRNIRIEGDWMLSDDGKTIKGYIGSSTDIVIPSEIVEGVKVENIGDNAFSGKGVTSVSIPEGIKTIGNQAFYSHKLTDVVIPSSVESIGTHAFGPDNYNIKSLTFVGYDDGTSHLTTISNEAFNASSSDNVVVYVPSSVTSIGSWGFENFGTVVYAGTATGANWGAKSVVSSLS